VQTLQDCFDSQILAYAHQSSGGLFCSQPGFSLSPLFRIWHVTFGQSFLGRLTSSATSFSFSLFINPSISLVEDSIGTPLFLAFITRSGLILLSLGLTDFVRTSFIFSDVFIVLASLVRYTRGGFGVLGYMPRVQGRAKSSGHLCASSHIASLQILLGI
jgi:hypothetical protein